MNSDNKKMYDKGINRLFDGIKEDYNKFTSYADGRRGFADGLHIKPGRKFDKVMNGTSAWGFIAKTDGLLKGIPYFVGDVFKAATYRAPAKHVRGSIFSAETNWYSWTGPRYLV